MFVRFRISGKLAAGRLWSSPFSLLFGAGFILSLLPIASASAVSGDDVSFSRDIRPILSENCFACHGPDEKSRESGLRLDLEASAKQNREGTTAVVPGKPEDSAIIRRIESTDLDEVMPPPRLHKTITPQQLTLLKQWIKQGARWGGHWSYEPVRRPAVPNNGQSNAIDAFLAERLVREKLSFAPAADQQTLIRRVALDVTGLPPTLEDLSSLAKARPEQIVAHYLAQPAFGEHWARPWLDLARYADSAGYPSDPGREIWSYRDWVIRALNSNMPFDQFTIEQLAGDLLPSPTDDQFIATAFHRNTMTNNEGGTSDEEFRTAAVIDRVNTTFAVWMGTTMACAQCHTHKYDPITNKEYFELYAFLNQTADADKRDESPLHELLKPDTKQKRAAWKTELAALDAALAKPKPEWLAGFDEWLKKNPTLADAKLKAAVALAPEKRSKEQVAQLQQHYVKNVSPASKAERERRAALEKLLAETKPVTVPVMVELEPAKHRKTFVQLRGNWQALGEEVTAGVPAAFPPLAKDAPRNRLTLARWLVSRDNPLTARVAVNRMWEAVFGVGIVRSSEEFGSQGDMPTHPELLDWLAAEFMESGWDVKHMLALMLNSRAYRQTSAASPELVERDPDNRLLARGPRFRPAGELLRDQALAVAGLLSPKMYGAPVRPQRPSLGLNTAFGGANDWQTSPGEDRHRRSIYTEVRRNSPYPSFSTFDAPNREVCTIRRGRSNTPLQAFVTLNDPVFVEAAQALARRIVKEAGPAPEVGLSYAFRLCLAREPSEKELAVLGGVYDAAIKLYRDDKNSAAQLSGTTQPKPEANDSAAADQDIAVAAAWTTVANVLLNLDEFLMRR
ncbi:MAG: PSD1 domain-containing protein [Planctomycetes bacterium]|nr:PSD1 domain-containing protein [Planctomycetota bacterium]